jgi:hypothetical protein
VRVVLDGKGLAVSSSGTNDQITGLIQHHTSVVKM